MNITLHRHHWDLLRPSDGMPLHEQVVWTYAPQAAAEVMSARTGLVSRRGASEPVEVEAPAFSYIDEGGHFWVQAHKLGSLVDETAKEPVRFPAEIVWSMASKGVRGFGMAKKRGAGPTLFDVEDPVEETPTNGAYGKETLRGLPLESQAAFSASVGRIREQIRDEIAAEKRCPDTPFERGMATVAVAHEQEREPCADSFQHSGAAIDAVSSQKNVASSHNGANSSQYMARGPAMTALVAQPEGWVPAPVRWPETKLAAVLQDVLVRLGQSSWSAICAEVEAAARACPDVARVVGRRLAGDATGLTTESTESTEIR